MDEERRVTEVEEVSTNREVAGVERQAAAHSDATDSRLMLARLVWWVVGVIIALLALRMLLQLLAANQGSAFVDFIYGISGFFAAPFFGMFSYTPAYGSSTFEVSTLVAIIIYALVGWGIGRLLTLDRPSVEV